MDVFRIGSRRSPMAMAQSEFAARLIQRASSSVQVNIVAGEAPGDKDQISKLGVHGGKGGAFVQHLRNELRAGSLEVLMHSLKDMPGNEEIDDLTIAAYLPRDDASDCLVVRPGVRADEIFARRGEGFKIGTNAVRRVAYIRRLLPLAELIHYRGAADKRIRKLDGGELQELPPPPHGPGGSVGPADALVLASSGLRRIGAEHRIEHIFSASEILPAVGQGIVALECREHDWSVRALLAQIDDPLSRACAIAEREVLWVLDGHCNSPIAAHATLNEGTLSIKASVMSEDGAALIEAEGNGPQAKPREVGRRVALMLHERGATKIIRDSDPATRAQQYPAPSS